MGLESSGRCLAAADSFRFPRLIVCFVETYFDLLNPTIEFDQNCDGAYFRFSASCELSKQAAEEELMYLKCAHPDCTSDFDYGHGRLFRFHQIPPHEQQPAHWHGVKHFWLCARCCEEYTIEYQKGLGVLLLQRLETLAEGEPAYFVLQHEVGHKPPLARRVDRARARQRAHKHQGDSAPIQPGAIEVLETRNMGKKGIIA
jgi:hypothetical protein